MLRLFALVDRGMPLPFGAVANRRSMLYVGNLVAAVRSVLERESAEGGDLLRRAMAATCRFPELFRMIGEALGKPARLLPVPPSDAAAGAAGARRPIASSGR